MEITSTDKNNAASVRRKVLTVQNQNTRYNIKCNQEKADKIVFLHAGSIVLTSSSPHLIIKTVNTDALTFAASIFPNLF